MAIWWVQGGWSRGNPGLSALDGSGWEKFVFAIKRIAMEKGDREILERAEARVLAQNFKTKEWLEDALKVSAKYYGESSKERIKKYMRQIWKEELLK